MSVASELPALDRAAPGEVVAALEKALGDDLISVVLFGSRARKEAEALAAGHFLTNTPLVFSAWLNALRNWGSMSTSKPIMAMKPAGGHPGICSTKTTLPWRSSWLKRRGAGGGNSQRGAKGE